jgi:hypothetical protein
MTDVPKITAPWTAEQVDALNRFQRLGHFHPFTCIEAHDGADRTLYATVNGWRCPHCAYQQDWAHPMMLVPNTLEKQIKLPCDVMLPPATVMRKGVTLDVLMTAFRVRAELPPEENRFDDPSKFSSPLNTPTTFAVPVEVNGADYSYKGAVIGVARKTSGVLRYVVEDHNGRLFIHNARQIGMAEGWAP